MIGIEHLIVAIHCYFRSGNILFQGSHVVISVLFSFASISDIPLFTFISFFWCAKAHGLAHVCHRAG